MRPDGAIYRDARRRVNTLSWLKTYETATLRISSLISWWSEARDEYEVKETQKRPAFGGAPLARP